MTLFTLVKMILPEHPDKFSTNGEGYYLTAAVMLTVYGVLTAL